MTFSQEKDGSKYLISIGAIGDDALSIWDLSQGMAIKSALVRGTTNQVKVDPNVDGNHLQFVTVGMEGCMMIWRYDLQE
jgi:hypothetical protein